MRKTTVYLDDDVAQRLRRLALARRQPQAELIREALVEYTAAARRPEPIGVGKYHSDRGDIARRDEELLFREMKPVRRRR
jgi:predicted transcriptional regulator